MGEEEMLTMLEKHRKREILPEIERLPGEGGIWTGLSGNDRIWT